MGCTGIYRTDTRPTSFAPQSSHRPGRPVHSRRFPQRSVAERRSTISSFCPGDYSTSDKKIRTNPSPLPRAPLSNVGGRWGTFQRMTNGQLCSCTFPSFARRRFPALLRHVSQLCCWRGGKPRRKPEMSGSFFPGLKGRDRFCPDLVMNPCRCTERERVWERPYTPLPASGRGYFYYRTNLMRARLEDHRRKDVKFDSICDISRPAAPCRLSACSRIALAPVVRGALRSDFSAARGLNFMRRVGTPT